MGAPSRVSEFMLNSIIGTAFPLAVGGTNKIANRR
jgi:hypothetical protein